MSLSVARILAIASLVVAVSGCDNKPSGKPVVDPKSNSATTTKSEPAPMNTNALLNPSTANETAPATFKARFTTSKGDFVVEVTRAWAPQGVDRFYNLVRIGYFNEIAMFRVVDGFMAQFGIHGDPQVSAAWRNAKIADDPVKESNKRGYMSFATSGPNSRTVQMFINFGDNARLDGMGFSPFAKIVSGMEIVDSIYKGYGEGAPSGKGPAQGRVQAEGNAYLKAEFPNLDYIKSVSIEK